MLFFEEKTVLSDPFITMNVRPVTILRYIFHSILFYFLGNYFLFDLPLITTQPKVRVCEYLHSVPMQNYSSAER